jgi:hypothetical protein
LCCSGSVICSGLISWRGLRGRIPSRPPVPSRISGLSGPIRSRCGLCGPRWRCNSHRRSRGTRRTQFRQFLTGHWYTRILGQQLLSRGKRWRRWGRRLLGDDRSAGNLSWRCCHTSGSIRSCSQNRCLCWWHSSPCSDRHRSNLLRIHSHGGLGDRLCTGEGALRHRGNRAVYVSVYVSDVIDRCVLVDYRCVVDIRDGGLIDGRVRYVHAIHVRRTHAIGRNINFAGAKREPRNRAAGRHASSDEHNQGRRINWPHFSWPWDPAPTVANVRPSSVVEGRISPWIVINPRPAPRINPRPMAGVIWRPARSYARKPRIAVIGSGLPLAVFIQIFKTNNPTIAVTSRGRILVAALAPICPIVEAVRRSDLINFCIQRISSTKRKSLAGVHRVTLAVAC